MNNHGVSGKTMNEVYDILKTMTLDQLNQCVTEAYIKMNEDERELFIRQISYTIAKKNKKEWFYLG